MVRNYFLISGFIAFSVYFILIFLLVFYLKTNIVKKVSVNKKETIIELQLVNLKNTDVKKDKKLLINSKELFKKTKIDTSIIKRSTSNSAKKKADFKSLFAKVDNKYKNSTNKDILNIKSTIIASRYKSKHEKQKKKKNVSLDELFTKTKVSKVVVPNLSMDKTSNDPYYSKIYTILSSRWIPVTNSKNAKAKVIISISINGNFSYKFIEYSNDSLFNKSLEDFLKSQTLVSYPKPKKETTIEITFGAKG